MTTSIEQNRKTKKQDKVVNPTNGLLFTLTFLLLAGCPALAQNTFTMKSVEASVHGTSSLHDWTSQVTQVECTGTFQSKNTTLLSMKNVQVKIGVASIKSSEGKIMDRKTYEAFHSDKNPFITYTFPSARVRMNQSDSTIITTSGMLTMAGTTHPVELTAKGKILTNGDLQFSFSKKLKMTDFNMKPPTAVLGTIKVGDEITLNFNMVLTHTLPL